MPPRSGAGIVGRSRETGGVRGDWAKNSQVRRSQEPLFSHERPRAMAQVNSTKRKRDGDKEVSTLGQVLCGADAVRQPHGKRRKGVGIEGTTERERETDPGAQEASVKAYLVSTSCGLPGRELTPCLSSSTLASSSSRRSRSPALSSCKRSYASSSLLGTSSAAAAAEPI